MNYIPKDKIEWKKVRYLKIPLEATDEEADWMYSFWLNEPLASWDVFSYWEKERIFSMREHLRKGDVLFDIGTEQGWCNLVYAEIVGPENMVLIEPTPEFWPNIKTVWEKNFDIEPNAFYDGFFSDKTTEKRAGRRFLFWPSDSEGDLIDRNSYRYIHEHKDIPQITIDDYVEMTGILPDALTMDTEGSELLILRGAEKTLKRLSLKVWVSIHPDLGLRDYGIKAEETIKFMNDLGYKAQFLAKDHEEHYYFSKDE